MPHKLIASVIIVLGMFAFSSHPTLAQTTAPGPYYATPSWDQKLQCDTTATCPRFIVLSNWKNEAVLDRETGLVWERSLSTDNYNWREALEHCNSLMVGNRVGWRLPALQELASLVDPSVSPPRPPLPPGHPFFNVQGAFYWSATSVSPPPFHIGPPPLANGVAFFDLVEGYPIFMTVVDKTIPSHVWCVRGGQGVNPQ